MQPYNFYRIKSLQALTVMGILYWLVVSTPLKNISQLGWLFPIDEKIKNVPIHQPVYVF